MVERKKITLVTYKVFKVLTIDNHEVSVKIETFYPFEISEDTYWFLQELEYFWDYNDNLYLAYDPDELIEMVKESRDWLGKEKVKMIKKEIKELYKKYEKEKADGCYIIFKRGD